MVRLLTYGSLRKGMHLHNNYLKGQKYIDTFTIKGYQMYSYGWYPFILPDSNNNIVAELYEVSDDIFSGLKVMEESAGYTTEYIKEHKAYMFVGNSKYLQSPNKVEHGDWVKYQGEKDD